MAKIEFTEDELNAGFAKIIQAEQKFREQYKDGLYPIAPNLELLTEFTKMIHYWYDLGYEQGKDEIARIWHSVVKDELERTLKEHPKMSLKTYCKKYWNIDEEGS